MMKRFQLVLFVIPAAILLCLPALPACGREQADTPSASTAKTEIRVTAKSVNLRAAANDQAEVVMQVSAGDILTATGLDGEWIEVDPPPGAYVWIYGDLVENGKVKAPKAILRAGAGTSFTSVGKLEKGATVQIKDEFKSEFGSWLKVIPPSNCRFYVSRKYVEPAKKKPGSSGAGSQTTSAAPLTSPTLQVQPDSVPMPPKPTGPAATIPVIAKKTDTNIVPAGSQLPEDITRDMLLTSREQGNTVIRKGTLNSSFFSFNRITKYTLTGRDLHGDLITLCYVLGNAEQLNSIVGKRATVTGKEYTLQGYRFPVIVPEQIVLKP